MASGETVTASSWSRTAASRRAPNPPASRSLPCSAWSRLRRPSGGRCGEAAPWSFDPGSRLRGWNGDQASPVGDLNRALDDIVAAHGPVPVVLIGHSMGARAAMRAAGHPAVYGVAGLAPWLPPGEPVEQLAGRRVLVAHGTADAITNPQETWAYVKRARAVTEVTAVEVRDGDHPMLRRARLWHAIAAEFARTVLELPAGSGRAGAGSVAAVVAQTAWEPPRTIV